MVYKLPGKCPQNSECEKTLMKIKGFLSHKLKPKPTWLLFWCPKPMPGHDGWRRVVEIHRTGPASSWAGDTDLGHVHILSLGGRLKNGTKTVLRAFPGPEG